MGHYDSGSISTCCEIEYYDDDWSFCCDLVIRDCSRQIELNFDCKTLEEIEQRVKKINTIRAHLDTIEQEMKVFFDAKLENGQFQD